MKFLCMQCDRQMTLVDTIPPDSENGISVLYGCPKCSQRIGMLTNPWETQVVSSLGVRIGRPPGEGGKESGDNLSKCPFGDVVRQMQDGDSAESQGPTWTPEASARLESIPEFVRPMARQGIEGYAKSNGHQRIDEKVLEEARQAFGM